jgi:hypothetical protein
MDGHSILKPTLGYLFGPTYPWQLRLVMNLLGVDARVLLVVEEDAHVKRQAGDVLNCAAVSAKSDKYKMNCI